jgi:hypothetical protein
MPELSPFEIRMRSAGRELALFWHDLRARTPRHSLMIVAIALAGAGFVGAALSTVSGGLELTAASPAKPAVTCERQVWPYLDDTCLRQENASHQARNVRVISLDRDAPASVPLPQAGAQKTSPKASKASGRSRDR